MIVDRIVQKLKDFASKRRLRRRPKSRATARRFEWLETRRPLAADVCEDPNLWLFITNDSPQGVATVDQFMAPTTEIQAPPPGMPGDENPNFAPPEIVALDYTWAGDQIVVFGWVIDDGDVGGLLVELGGPLGNSAAYTDADGYFSFAADLITPYGTISAIAVDHDGMASDPVYIYIN